MIKFAFKPIFSNYLNLIFFVPITYIMSTKNKQRGVENKKYQLNNPIVYFLFKVSFTVLTIWL